MKRIICFVICLTILFSLTGCKSKEVNKYESLEVVLIESLKRGKYLDENNFSSLHIKNTIEHGYYKNSPNKKYVQINFTYECKDKNDKCIHDVLTKLGDYYTLIIYTDYKKIYEVTKGISIDYKDIETGEYKKIEKMG